jgi:hypothetical protein
MRRKVKQRASAETDLGVILAHLLELVKRIEEAVSTPKGALKASDACTYLGNQ